MHRVLPLLLLLGCPADDTGDEPSGGTATVGDSHNATLVVGLEAQSVPLAQALDHTISWGDLSADLMGRPIDPAVDITQARIFSFLTLDQTTIMDGLAMESLEQSDVSFIVSCTPTDSSCLLSEFVTIGHWIIPESDFVDGLGLWLVELKGDADAGPRAYAFLEPSAASATEDYAFSDGSSSMSATLALADDAVPTPAGTDVSIDWSGLGTDAQGREVDPEDLDRVVLYRFTEGDQASAMLGWDDAAAERWSLEVDEPQALLSALEGPTDFTGLTDADTWILALYCGRCDLPVPRLIAKLQLDG